MAATRGSWQQNKANVGWRFKTAHGLYTCLNAGLSKNNNNPILKVSLKIGAKQGKTWKMDGWRMTFTPKTIHFSSRAQVK